MIENNLQSRVRHHAVDTDVFAYQTKKEGETVKYIVGYQATDDGRFLREIIAAKDAVREVYFSFGDFPNGRSSLAKEDGVPLYEKQKRQMEDLETLARAGLSFNLLFNGNCYGRDSQSRAFFHKVGETVDYLGEKIGIASVTTSSPLIARFIRENFDGIDVRASVNMEIGSVEGLEYVADVFDSFYIKRECNRDAARLAVLREWCNKNGREMYLLANSGCLNNCSAHTFHDNLVSHEAEIAAMDNGYAFEGVCWAFLGREDNRDKWLSRTNFIRPEDISLYAPYTAAVKLATRVNRDPCRVLRAYLAGGFSGGINTILEPDHSGALYPTVVENKKLPADFGQTVMNCDRKCDTCGYCKQAMENASVNLGGMYDVDKSND